MISFRNPRHSLALALLSTLLLATAATSFAQGTQLWTQSRFAELEKGTPLGVSIASDGALRRGPQADLVNTTSSSFVWAVAVDKSGTAYLATGSPASVLRITLDGKSTTLFTSKALAVQSLAFGPDGALYAATMPDGRVYKLDPAAKNPLDSATAKPIFDLAAASSASPNHSPEDKSKDKSKDSAEKPESRSHYIWAMTFDPDGRLYLATGGPGIVYRLDPTQLDPAHPGQPATAFFTSDEQHIRSLAWDKSGNLIAGSDGSGLVYRIGHDGKAYVLFSAPRREITALAVGADGTIYAADVGDKSRSPLPALPVSSGGPGITITFNQPGSVQAANASSALPEGSEIYALTPNAAPRKLWDDHEDILYSLAATPTGLLALTGNQGKILEIGFDGSTRDLAHLNAQQAIALALIDGGWLVGAANPGRLYRLTDGGPKSEHAYASDVLDADAVARWGRIEVDPASRGFHLFTRSGNVEQPVRREKDWGWTDWQPVTDGKITSPSGRYLQWKAALDPDGLLSGVAVNYLPVNAAPVIDDLVVVPGARYTPQAPASSPTTVNIVFPAAPDGATASSDGAASSPLQATKDKSAVTARWAAHDDNGDDLAFDLYLRGDGETLWRPLKHNLTDRAWTFDATTLPDGGYQIKVVASDLPSHTPADALTGQKVSARFLLDTTPPVVSDLGAETASSACPQAAANPNTCLAVHFSAQDATSPISRAQYSLDAGPWQFIEPVGQLSDSLTEHYAFAIPLPAVNEPEHLVTVRVFDRYDNSSAAKLVVPAHQPSGVKKP